jgi:hypothetical protein
MLLQAATPSPPPALPPLHGGPAPMTCPVGGERFRAWQPAVYSTFGERPDGRPYSYLSFPFPLPECPGNKLLLFSAFTPVEVARLPALLASAEYRRLVAEETSYFRAAWLSERLGRGPVERLWLLNTATWQVKGGDLADPAQPDKARRYNFAFARGVATLPAGVNGVERIALLARGANAWRELGDFAAAERMRREALAAGGAEAEEKGWARYLELLGKVIARRDSSVEPDDMIPERQRRSR